MKTNPKPLVWSCWGPLWQGRPPLLCAPQAPGRAASQRQHFLPGLSSNGSTSDFKEVQTRGFTTIYRNKCPSIHLIPSHVVNGCPSGNALNVGIWRTRLLPMAPTVQHGGLQQHQRENRAKAKTSSHYTCNHDQAESGFMAHEQEENSSDLKESKSITLSRKGNTTAGQNSSKESHIFITKIKLSHHRKMFSFFLSFFLDFT